MNTITQITQSHLSVFVFDKTNNNPIKRMPMYAEIAVLGKRKPEVIDANTINIISDFFQDAESKTWLVESLEKYFTAAYFNRLSDEERNNLIQSLVEKISFEIQAIPNATKAKKKAIVDLTVKKVAAELNIPAPQPQAEFETLGAYPLGMLATDHVGYLSYNLKNVPKNPFPMYNNLQFAVYLYPMGKEAAKIDALQQGRVTPDVILAKLEIDKPVFEANLKALNLPAMQNPDLADWYMSPGSFAALPSALIGADGCENLFPANFATQEFRFRQIVRLSDVPPGHPDFPDTYKFGYLDEYKVSLIPIGHSLGEIKYSLPLAPGESVKLAIVDWTRTDSSVRNEDTSFKEQLYHNQMRDRTITETLTAALKEMQRGGSGVDKTDFSAGKAVSGAASGALAGLAVGGGPFGAIAGALVGGVGGGLTGDITGTHSTSEGSRDLASKNVQKISDSISQASSALREFHSTVVVQSKQEEKENIQTRTFTNYNHSHTLTILYYEILRHFRVVTEWVSRKPLALLPFEKLPFSDDLILLHRHLLEPNLIDSSLKAGIDSLEKLIKIKNHYEVMGLNVNSDNEVVPFWEGDLKFQFYEIGLSSGTKFKKVGQSDESLTGFIYTTNGTKLRIRTILQNDVNLNKSKVLDYEDFTVRVLVTAIDHNDAKFELQWKDFAGLELRLGDNDELSLDKISLYGFHLRGKVELIPETNIDVYFPYNDCTNAFTNVKYPQTKSASTYTQKPEKTLTEEELYSILKLKKHLTQFNEHYNRVIYLNKDSNATSEWFEAHRWGSAPSNQHNGQGPGFIIDHVEPLALEVFGSYIAYPYLEKNQLLADKLNKIYDAIMSDDPARHEWAVKEMQDIDPKDFEKVLTRSMQSKSKTEKLISIPTRGVFAEGKLGHCNISEEIDNTRFWKWEEHPIPINAPDINPVNAVTPQNTQQNVQPTAFPSSTVNIVSPSPAPDPHGLAEALKLIATPNIFRDMSGRQETADLIKKLGDGSIDFNDAVKKAKEIEEKYGKDLTGSNYINSPSSVDAVKNVQQLSDANKSLVGYASPETIKQNANKISDSYADLAELVKQEKVQELDERLALNGNGVITTNISIEVPVIFKAINIRDKKAIPNNPSVFISDNLEIPIPNLPFSNWAQDGVEQYGSHAIPGRINTIKGIVLHETAGFNWTGVSSGLSVQFHINRDGKVCQHNDAHSMCQHIHLLNGSHVGIEHVNDPFHKTPNKTPYEDLPRQEITWGYGSNWLTIPPSEQLKSSALFIQELINKLSISQKWCQLMEVDTDLINPAKYNKNSRTWISSNQKNRIHFLINTGGNNFFVQHCRQSNKIFDGIIAHAVAFETNSGLNHNDGSIYAFYSWLVLEKKIPHQQALNILQGYLTNDDNIVRATLKFSTGGNAFFVDVTDIV